MTRVEEPLPLGASTRYTVDPRHTIYFVSEDKLIAEQSGEPRFTCPLVKVTDKEAKELEAQLVREAVRPRELRVIDAGGSRWGFFVTGGKS